MNDKNGAYQIVEMSAERRGMAAYQELKGERHCMYGLLEVDVTTIRQYIDDHKAQTGETLSFAGFLTFCLARAVDEDKTIQAYRKGDRRLVMFDDVDVGITIERQIGSTRAPMGHVLRRAAMPPSGTLSPRESFGLASAPERRSLTPPHAY